jgi:hypothetical protein
MSAVFVVCRLSAYAAKGRHGETTPKLGDEPASEGGPSAVCGFDRP